MEPLRQRARVCASVGGVGKRARAAFVGHDRPRPLLAPCAAHPMPPGRCIMARAAAPRKANHGGRVLIEEVRT